MHVHKHADCDTELQKKFARMGPNKNGLVTLENLRKIVKKEMPVTCKALAGWKSLYFQSDGKFVRWLTEREDREREYQEEVRRSEITPIDFNKDPGAESALTQEDGTDLVKYTQFLQLVFHAMNDLQLYNQIHEELHFQYSLSHGMRMNLPEYSEADIFREFGGYDMSAEVAAKAFVVDSVLEPTPQPCIVDSAMVKSKVIGHFVCSV